MIFGRTARGSTEGGCGRCRDRVADTARFSTSSAISPATEIATASDQLRSRLAQLALLTLATSCAAVSRSALGPLQETIRIELAISDNQIALIQGMALAVPVVLASIPLGLAIDRVRRVRLLGVLLFLSLCGGIATALSPGFAWLFLSRSIVGVTAMGVATTAISLMADYFPPSQRGRAKAVLVIGQYGGVSAAFAVGGSLVSLFEGSASAWRWSVAMMAIPLIPLLLLLLLFLREPVRQGCVRAQTSPHDVLRGLWSYRGIVASVGFGIVCADIAYFAALTWTAPTLSRNFGFTAAQVGGAMAVAVLVSGLAGPVLGGVISDLAHRAGGPAHTLRILSCIVVLGLFPSCFAVLTTWSGTVASLIVMMTLLSAAQAIGLTLFTIVIPNELRGLCISLLLAAISLVAVGLAPLAVSALSRELGGPMQIGLALSLVCASACLIGAAILHIAPRHLPTRTIEQ